MIDIPIMLAKLSVPIMILESLLLYSDQQNWDQLEQWVVRPEDLRLIIFKRFQSNPQIIEPLCQTWNGPWKSPVCSNLTLNYCFETISLLQLHIVEVYQWISYAFTWLNLLTLWEEFYQIKPLLNLINSVIISSFPLHNANLTWNCFCSSWIEKVLSIDKGHSDRNWLISGSVFW